MPCQCTAVGSRSVFTTVMLTGSPRVEHERSVRNAAPNRAAGVAVALLDREAKDGIESLPPASCAHEETQMPAPRPFDWARDRWPSRAGRTVDAHDQPAHPLERVVHACDSQLLRRRTQAAEWTAPRRSAPRRDSGTASCPAAPAPTSSSNVAHRQHLGELAVSRRPGMYSVSRRPLPRLFDVEVEAVQMHRDAHRPTR